MQRLKTDHALFQRLKNESPPWWKNLKSDPEIYIDIRKDNSLNAYYNGGAIMKLAGENNYKAQIHVEYIPLNRASNYIPYEFHDKNVDLNSIESIKINNFGKDTLAHIKKRIRSFNPNDSEKGIQGQYVVKANNRSISKSGFFIDTEIKYIGGRIDMVWVDLEEKKIAFVELKTMRDQRLFIDAPQAIAGQLYKYKNFACEYKNDLLDYYKKIFFIKKELGILPKFVKESSLENYELIEKPILLIGDCSQNWIKKYAGDLNIKLEDIAFGCIYQGKTTFDFNIPFKTVRYSYRLDKA